MRYVDGPLRMGMDYEYISAHMKTKQRTTNEEAFNDHVATKHECPTCQHQKLNSDS